MTGIIPHSPLPRLRGEEGFCGRSPIMKLGYTCILTAVVIWAAGWRRRGSR